MHGVARVGMVLVFLALALSPGRAGDAATGDLIRAMQVERLVAVMAQEGLRYGAELRAELFPDQGGPRWDAAVRTIHAPDRMLALVADALARGYAGNEAAAEVATGFFRSDLGQRIITLELAAREALLDTATKEAAEVALEDMRAGDPGRLALIERFVRTNDLIESNVAGALNANLAFYRGMIEGGAIDPSLSEQEMMADLWGQEDQVRADTEGWIYPYLALAYAPLGDGDLDAYIAFSATTEGRALNTALFAAFDALFAQLSFDLGLAAAVFLQGQDL
ncbi:MAG: DUF2059 domain-containing protein [Gemmobacter sp.]